MTAVLQALDVSVRFGGNMALISATVDVASGSITGLIGPNGAGKTTLFNVLTGLQDPVAGRVLLEGVDITRAAPHDRAKRGMARTFQRIELFGSLTARENLEVAAEIRREHAPTKTPQKRVDEAIDLVGIRPFVDQRADQLTTGQARLVELGRALVTRPTVLLLDEPASGLDAQETQAFARLLEDLARDGLAILLVEHDIPLVMRVCHYITVLDLGRVIAVGSPTDIRQNQTVISAYLGTGVM